MSKGSLEATAWVRRPDWRFRFDRSGCASCPGHCCTGDGGQVWVTEHEARTIATYLQEEWEAFSGRALRAVAGRLSLTERWRPRGDLACVLFDDETASCSVYPVRPPQCRSFPFWETYKDNPAPLQRECPAVELDD